METFNFITESLQEEFDKVKELILINMVDEKLLTEAQAEEYSKKHTVIIKKPSTISRWLKKWKTSDNLHIMIAKVPIVSDD